MGKYCKIIFKYYKMLALSKIVIKNFFSIQYSYLVYSFFVKKSRWYFHKKLQINGLRNVHCKHLLIGLGSTGFNHKGDLSVMNIQGILKIQGRYTIGRGSRIVVGKNGKLTIGHGGYLNSNCILIAMDYISIGDNCIVGWDCQIMDDDFHTIIYKDKSSILDGVIIGNNVWIGSGVKIFKGSRIPDNSVIAANSVVRGDFKEPNTLIAGTPAIVKRKEIHWK